jgi:phosphoglycolate phosphatase
VKLGAVIFDLDGTLVDTLQDIADAANRVLAAANLSTFDYDWYRQAIGNGMRQLVTLAIPESDRHEQSIEARLSELVADYGRHCLVKTRPYAGIPEALRNLHAAGLRLAVNSNKPDDFTRRIVEALFEPGLFEVVIGAQHGIPLKPDPTAALSIADELGVAPARTAYIGDSHIDMATATAAGMLPIGVSWGFRSREELAESGAVAVLDHPRELPGLLTER